MVLAVAVALTGACAKPGEPKHALPPTTLYLQPTDAPTTDPSPTITAGAAEADPTVTASPGPPLPTVEPDRYLPIPEASKQDTGEPHRDRRLLRIRQHDRRPLHQPLSP